MITYHIKDKFFKTLKALNYVIVLLTPAFWFKFLIDIFQLLSLLTEPLSNIMIEWYDDIEFILDKKINKNNENYKNK